MVNIFILCATKSHPMEQNKRMHMSLIWACKKSGKYKTESLLWDSIANKYNHDLLFVPRFVFTRENLSFNYKGVELWTCDIAQTSEFRLLSLWTNSLGLTIQTKLNNLVVLPRVAIYFSFMKNYLLLFNFWFETPPSVRT